MSFKTVKLLDIAKPKQWKNLPSSELTEEGYFVYGANGIIGKYTEYNHEFPTLVITCRGATCGSLHITKPKSYINSNAMALDNLSDDVNIKYLYYALFNRGFKNVITGSAQPQITREGLSKIKIPLPSLPEQIHIAEILSQAENLITQRKESILLLDELLKSTFLEMFGDPVKNEKGWEKVPLSKLGSFKNGINYTKNEKGFDVLYLSVSNFKNESKLKNLNELSRISLKTLPSYDYFLKNNDLVFVRSNGNKELVGRCVEVFPNDEKVTFSGFCIRFRLEDENVNSTYLSHLFRNSSFKKNMLQNGRGANIQNINQSILGDMEITKPPIAFQNQFATIVEKVETLKAEYQASLKELENMYGVLSQKAFKGELKVKEYTNTEVLGMVAETKGGY